MRGEGAGEGEMVGEGVRRKVEKKKRKKNKKKKKKDGDPPNPPEVDVSIPQQALPPQDLVPQFWDKENPNPDQFAPVHPFPKKSPLHLVTTKFVILNPLLFHQCLKDIKKLVSKT